MLPCPSRRKIQRMAIRMLNIFDSHIHSDNSPDGEDSMASICEHAAARGVMGAAITDHCDIDLYEQEHFKQRIFQSVFEARKAGIAFQGMILLTAGIELGNMLFDAGLARDIASRYPYDFILGSVHTSRGVGGDYYYKDFSSMAQQEIDAILAGYFEEVLQMVRLGLFDVCAHLTYPLRYITGRDKVPCSLRKASGCIDAILKSLIEQGKGLELNTSGLYGDYGCTMPQMDVLRRYRELGGEIVTIGSDAHHAKNVGGGVEQGMEMLRECGFRYFAFYKGRKPRMLEIV